MTPTEAASRVRETEAAVLGRTPPTSSGASGQPLPAKEKDLKTGTIYQTGRGPAKWNGKAFETVK